MGGDEACVTPTSAFLEPPANRGAVNAVAANQRMNHAPLQMVDMNALQASQAIPDQRVSPDINSSLPQFWNKITMYGGLLVKLNESYLFCRVTVLDLYQLNR